MSGCPIAKIPYRGAAPGADSNDYVLFSSLDLPSARFCALAGTPRIVVSVKSDAGETDTIRLETTHMDANGNRGSTWSVAHEETPAGSATEANVYDFQVGQYDDFRIVWENSSGAAKTTFDVDIMLVDEHSPTQGA